MDFGEILKLWDAKTGAAALAEAGRGDGKDGPKERRLTKKELDALPVDARLDLHGLTAAEAEDALASFFAAAERGGCRKLMIVHGKGLHSASEPVLAGVVRRWLERRPSAGKSGHPDSANGGTGATWVLLKERED
ncbi:MAG TPA: Smr/MutS family protein [Spirochaetales bacterium]|nr:Smr/MutS family protein [Spirochaetales bacterium]